MVGMCPDKYMIISGLKFGRFKHRFLITSRAAHIAKTNFMKPALLMYTKYQLLKVNLFEAIITTYLGNDSYDNNISYCTQLLKSVIHVE